MLPKTWSPHRSGRFAMSEQFWWFLARGSGVVAWLFLTASVLSGIFLSTDLFPKHRRPAWLLDLHRWLGGLTVAFMVVHVASLIADSYVQFNLVDVLVPFASEWRPVPVALGVLGMWGLVAVEATSLAMKRLPKRTWRAIHLTSYATFWLSGLHGAFAGTDALQPLFAISLAVSVVAVVFTVTYRMLNGRKRSRPTGAARTALRSVAENR